MKPSLAVAILAAGKGKRMKSELPKVLFDICGKPALFYPLQAASQLKPERRVVVVGFSAEKIKKAFQDQDLKYVLQKELLGTGHALLMTRDSLSDFKGDLLVLYGDGPLIRTETLEKILSVHRNEKNMATVLTAVKDDPTGYGRVIRDRNGGFVEIIEEKDADEETKRIREVNTGVTVYRCPEVFDYLALLKDDNRQKEYYLTDLPQIYKEKGCKVGLLLHDDPAELDGFNSIAQLADLRRRVMERIMSSHMERGVHVLDPGNTYIDHDVEIGPGTRILPFTVIQGKVKIGNNCSVGPFAYLRDGADLDEQVGVGAFVEVKKSRLGRGSLSRHLTYLGDTQVGCEANIGAGTITANYDGQKKSETVIGDRAFIGSGTVIIAPAEIGAGCTVAAGAVITHHTRTEPGSVYMGVPARRYEPKEGNR